MFRTAYCTSGAGCKGSAGTTKVTKVPKDTGTRTPVPNVKRTAVPTVTKKKNAPASRVR